MFDTLVIATGGIPRRLPIPGADLENVYTLRGLPDAKKIDEGTYPHCTWRTFFDDYMFSCFGRQKFSRYW